MKSLHEPAGAWIPTVGQEQQKICEVSGSQRINKWQIVVSCDLPYFISCFSKQLYRVYLNRSLLAAQLNA
jgi:hypothetical protein